MHIRTPANHTHTHLPLGVVAASLAEGLGEDGDGRVDGVRDDADERLGAGVGDSLGEGRADASVDLEEVVTAALLAWAHGAVENIRSTGEGEQRPSRLFRRLTSCQACGGHRRG